MSRDENRVHFFFLIWAAASLIHRLAFSSWVDSNLGWAAVAGSLALLALPRSGAALLFFLTTNSIYLFDLSPHVANHLLFEAILNPTLLIALLVCVWHARSLRVDRGRFLSLFSPVARGQLILLYAFAALHKLNWDFFDPAISCGSVMFQETVTTRLGADFTVPVWTRMPVIVATVVSEASIGLLLWFRKTRHLGVAVGLVFHALLGLHPNIGIYSFTAMLYGLYALFLSDRAIEVACRAAFDLKAKVLLLAGFVGTTIWQQLATQGMSAGPARFLKSDLGFYPWVAFSLALGGLYGFAMWRSRETPGDLPLEGSVRPGRPGLLWLMLVPILITGLSPYIGLKTQGTFSMFSNLRTEGVSNHLFLKQMDLFPHQSDIVVMTGSSHRGLANWATRQSSMTYFEFRQVVSSVEGDFIVEFFRGGEHHSMRKRDAEGEEADLFDPHPWWLEKFLAFRRLPDPEKPMPCRW